MGDPVSPEQARRENTLNAYQRHELAEARQRLTAIAEWVGAIERHPEYTASHLEKIHSLAVRPLSSALPIEEEPVWSVRMRRTLMLPLPDWHPLAHLALNDPARGPLAGRRP